MPFKIVGQLRQPSIAQFKCRTFTGLSDLPKQIQGQQLHGHVCLDVRFKILQLQQSSTEELRDVHRRLEPLGVWLRGAVNNRGFDAEHTIP